MSSKFLSLIVCLLLVFCLVLVPQSVKVKAAEINPSGFEITGGDVEDQTNGATWTYNSTDDGVLYDINGILFKPAGTGPFPAVIISHGKGGNVTTYSIKIAREMVKWGLVCIATNYTHAAYPSGVGSPGECIDENDGASIYNIQRAQKCMDILSYLGYVEMNRVAAHGYSKGGFLTIGLVGAYPAEFIAASDCAGGINPVNEPYAQNIITPYTIHCGDADVGQLPKDIALQQLLNSKGVPNEFFTYPGYTHGDIPFDALMLSRVHTWYTNHGMFITGATPTPTSTPLITPTPTKTPTNTPATTPTAISTPTITPSSTASTLFADGFESNNFTTGGWTNNGCTIGSAYKMTGNYAAILNSTDTLMKFRSTSGKSNIEVQYARYTRDCESTDHFIVEWSTDGITWTNLEDVTGSSVWIVKTWALPSGANNNTSFRIRFRTSGYDTSTDFAHLDDVKILGTP